MGPSSRAGTWTRFEPDLEGNRFVDPFRGVVDDPGEHPIGGLAGSLDEIRLYIDREDVTFS